MASFGLGQMEGMRRDAWKPELTVAQVEQIRRLARGARAEFEREHARACCVVAFHNGGVWPEEELATRLASINTGRRHNSIHVRRIASMLEQLGEAGRKRLKRLKGPASGSREPSPNRDVRQK
jgi:hypothetical protein